LYSSAYAAMTRSLHRDLENTPDAERQEWIEYLNHCQDDDGLYRDPVIFDQAPYKGVVSCERKPRKALDALKTIYGGMR
jgi:hypothetical protein